MADQALLPDPRSLHLLHVEAEGNVITMVVRTTASEARCSLCGSPSIVNLDIKLLIFWQFLC
jgi:hypothetical protein